MERLEPRIIYTLEHKDAHKDAKKEAQKESAHGEPVATEQGVSGQPVETPAKDQQEDAQKAPEAPASEEPIVAEVPVEAPADNPTDVLAGGLADAPTEPVTGGATEPSAVAEVSVAAGADDPTEAFNPITQNAAIGEKADGEKPKN